MRLTRLGHLLFLAPSLLAAQAPATSVRLEWPGLRVSIAPDSGGTRFVVETYTVLSPNLPALAVERTMYADPVGIKQWLPFAREFMARELAEADTGKFRGSEILPLIGDQSLALARRRVDDKWSGDQIIVIQFRDRDPLIIPLTQTVVRTVIDSLESVAGRTITTPTAMATVTARTASATGSDTVQVFEEPPQPSPRNLPPRWPRSLRDSTMRAGTVVLDFVVKADGTVDMKSIKVLKSPDPAFLDETLRALRTFRFVPAKVDGKPADVHVRQSFQFSRERP